MNLLLHPRRIRNIPVAITAARFVQKSISMPTSSFWETDAGTHLYQVFEPASAAKAAQGWTKHRVIVCLDGAGGSGTDGTKMMNGGGNSFTLPIKCGWGFTQDGSAQVPNQTFPALVVFVQKPATWTYGPGSTQTAGILAYRRGLELIAAELDKTLTEYDCDPKRCYLIGLSAGAIFGWEYLYFDQSRFACYLSTSGAAAVTTDRIPPTPSSLNPTIIASAMHAVPVMQYNGLLDSSVPVAGARDTRDAMIAAGATDYSYTEYSDTDHNGTWERVYTDAGNTIFPLLYSKSQP